MVGRTHSRGRYTSEQSVQDQELTPQQQLSPHSRQSLPSPSPYPPPPPPPPSSYNQVPSSALPPSSRLVVHTVVEQPLTLFSVGRISCRPTGRDPISFSWCGPNGAEVQTDASGAEAFGVVPGRYRIDVVDGSGATAELSVDVEPAYSSAVVVREYRVTPASTSSSRDGSVEVVGHGVSHCRFLWTNGAETDGPLLRDVPCGVYVATALPRGGKVPTMVHACAPALVGCRWGGGKGGA